MVTPVVVDFPLRGEWVAPNTPGKRVPSHGTDLLGERYAYDFVRLGPGTLGTRFYHTSPLHYLLFGVRLQDCYGWGQPIYSATTGVVVTCEDGWPERNPVNAFRDALILFRNARLLHANANSSLRELAGNYVIIESTEGFAVYAHAQTGSIKVRRGEEVRVGQVIANVGHSGNSTAPHLHFHLMDHADPRRAQGILCCFRDYQVLEHGVWQSVRNGIPKHTDRIRKL